MDYLFNVMLGAAGPLIILTLVWIGVTLQCKQKEVVKYKNKVWLGLVVLVVAFNALQPSITYKNTTDYNKQQDIYNINRQQPEVTEKIVDKTLKPKQDDQDRKESFENLTKY